MSFLDQVKGLLSQYGSDAKPTGDPAAHFQQIAQSVDSNTLAEGIAAAMRSDQTPPFGKLVSQLFVNGSTDQKASMLNTLLSAIPASQRGQLAAIAPALAGTAAVSGGQAAGLSPDTVTALAQHVEKHDAGIVDKMSTLYAAHPALVKTLGSTAMIVAMRKIAERHSTVA
jgi:hypothetical protein